MPTRMRTMFLQATIDSLMSELKRLLYQSNHRGCKEMDILLGNFATHMLHTLSQYDLLDYAALLEVSDAQIYDWLVGRAAIPHEFDTSILRELIKFSYEDKV